MRRSQGIRLRLRLLTLSLWLAFAACLQQVGPSGEPANGGLMGAAEVRSAGGSSSDSGGDADNAGSDAFAAPSSSQGASSSVIFNQGPTAMPAGTAAPTHDPEGTWRYALKGTSKVSCAFRDSNRVTLEIRGSIQVATTHYEQTPSGEFRLTNEPQRIISDSGIKTEVLRTVFKNNDQLLFFDQVPASSTPSGLSIRGVDLALVDLEVATTDPDSVYFLVISKESSPLFGEQPHASGLCGASDCQSHFGRFTNEVLTQWLTALPSPDPLPECSLPPKSLFISPMTVPEKATP